MITAPVPIHTLTLPILVSTAKASLLKTIKAGGSGSFTATNCRKTSKQYGLCHFSMIFKSKKTGKTFHCAGSIMVRDVGKGPESAYGPGAVCNGKRVS